MPALHTGQGLDGGATVGGCWEGGLHHLQRLLKLDRLACVLGHTQEKQCPCHQPSRAGCAGGEKPSARREEGQ